MGNKITPRVSVLPGLEKKPPYGHLYGMDGDVESVTEYIMPKNTCRTVGEYAFSHFRSLKRLVLSEGITSILAEAFTKCSELEEIVLPSTLKSIGSETFSGCRKLRSITYHGSEENGLLPPALLEIGDDAFRDCTALSAITVPEGIAALGGCLFADSGIRSLTLLGIDRLRHLAGNAFASCRAKIRITGTTHKPTVPYTPEMGEHALPEAYAERMRGLPLLEQAAHLTFSYPSTKKDAPVLCEGSFHTAQLVDDLSSVRALVMDGDLLVGYVIGVFGKEDGRRVNAPILVGQFAHVGYDVDYVHTGDNNGAGYLGDDDDNTVSTPEYSRLQYFG